MSVFIKYDLFKEDVEDLLHVCFQTQIFDFYNFFYSGCSLIA